MMNYLLAVGLFVLSFNLFASTLDEIKERGSLNCGISGALPGFSEKIQENQYLGFDVDYCKALAAAIDVPKVNYVELTAQERLEALKAGKIDVLSRTTTWTLSRDTGGLTFIGTIFYDGEGFMVPASFQHNDDSAFSDATFCIRKGTTSSLNLARYFGPKGITYKEKVYENQKAVDAAYLSRDCQIYVLDASALASLKASFTHPEKHKILDIRISKEPLSPAVKDDDANWEDITRWTLFLLFALEEQGIKNSNLANQPKSAQLFMKSVGSLSKKLNLDENWGNRVLDEVGNYQSIFERHLGQQSNLKLERGMNASWIHGGLLYSPPFS